MNPLLRNILAVVAGILLGGLVNMGLVMIGSSMIPLEGITDPNDMDAMIKAMENAETKHFIFPFLAHAIGTLTGAIIASRIAGNQKMTFALVIGCFFLVGGIAAILMIPGPTWFAFLDLAIAYLPMAWLGGKWGTRLSISK